MSNPEGVFFEEFEGSFVFREDDPFNMVACVLGGLEYLNADANAYYQEPFTGRFVGQNTFVFARVPVEVEHFEEEEPPYYGD